MNNYYLYNITVYEYKNTFNNFYYKCKIQHFTPALPIVNHCTNCLHLQKYIAKIVLLKNLNVNIFVNSMCHYCENKAIPSHMIYRHKYPRFRTLNAVVFHT